jgi:ubiquinone/menaquinone biosynthesis C-methylase UbiE
VSHALDLAGVATMLDVGGGLGHYARALCDAAPSLRAVVLDRPEVVALGRAEVAGTALEDRLAFVAGDYLEDEAWGEGFDLVLLANVLHQESAGRAAMMVQRAARALAPGGRVAIVDFRIDDHRREHLLGTLFAINMREFGDTWTEPDLRGWLQAASLDDLHRTDIGPDRWLLTGRASRLRRP